MICSLGLHNFFQEAFDCSNSNNNYNSILEHGDLQHAYHIRVGRT